jgi:hypothetical protein
MQGENMMRVLPLVLSAAVGLGLISCGKKPDGEAKQITIPGPNGNVAFSGSGNSVTIKGNDGKTVFEVNANGVTNAKTPDFAPLYPGAKVQAAFSSHENGSQAGTVTLLTQSAAAEIIGFYKQKAQAAGLAETLSMSSGGTQIYAAGNDKTKQSVQVSAANGNGGTQVQVTWSGKAE